jgi:hypothetical protein
MIPMNPTRAKRQETRFAMFIKKNSIFLGTHGRSAGGRGN